MFLHIKPCTGKKGCTEGHDFVSPDAKHENAGRSQFLLVTKFFTLQPRRTSASEMAGFTLH